MEHDNSGAAKIGTDSGLPSDTNQGFSSPAGFITPYKIGSGVMRGTQIIANNDNSKITLGKIPSTSDFGIQLNAPNSSSNVTLDGTSNALYVTGADGTKIGMGLIPDGSGDFGFFSVDSSGFLLFKIVGSTWFWYDKVNKTNIMQVGLLPDANYGWVTVPSINNVSDAFTT